MNCRLVGFVVFAFAFTAQLSAQQPVRPASTSTVNIKNKDGAWQQRLEASLAHKVSLDAKDVPLKEVIKDLADQADFPFHLSKKIEDAGVQSDTPVTGTFAELTLLSVLNQLLEDYNLTFRLSNEMIVITTIEDAQNPEHVISRVYPVKDLLEARTIAEKGEAQYDFTPLQELIRGAIEPDSWGEGNQTGSLQGFSKSGAIVVTHRWSVQQRVAQLLVDLRRAQAEQNLDGKDAAAQKQ
ncbi:hypothetical protein [Anatilimnocola floriformis]|uniref:hypothetical protein n=1 Tax=Anatilimnocola floriformis TaxID=2948575 RepID=UPI0020C50355|nr:hypothetical protein [Anatilimnocola floriformis]